MKFRQTLSLVVPFALVVALASCADDPAMPAADAGVTATTDAGVTTTTDAAGTAADITTAPTTPATAPPATAPPATAPPATAPPATAPPATAPPATAPPATAPPATTPVSGARPPSNGVSDASTGLVVGPPAQAPEGTTLNQTIKGEAMISIDGSFPLSLSGGLCSFVDTTLFIQAGDVSGDFITLSFVTRNMSIAAITDTSTISDISLVWQAGPSKTAGSYRGATDIVFDRAGISGSFAGAAVITGAGIRTDTIEFGGRFSCLPSPFQIRGAHGLNLTAARCNSADSYVSAGTPSGDGALLAFDPDSLSRGDRSTNAALSFRIDTIVYTSRWALAEIDPDGLGATFEALMAGPDGIVFLVEGGFSCH